MKWLAALLLFLLLPSAAQAQFTVRCGSFDTNSLSTTQLPALGICNVTTGPNGIIYATANSEQGCSTGSTAGAQLWVGAGTSPISGVNFAGNISAPGQLTVTALTGAFGYHEITAVSITTAGTPGSGTPGQYNNVVATGGSGASGSSNAVSHLDVTVGAGGTVTAAVPNNQLATYSIGFHVGDVLSVASGLIGGTSGFTATVTTISPLGPWVFQAGQTIMAAEFNKQTATITSQASSSLPGGDLGMLGVYNISDSTVTGNTAGLTDAFALPALPGGLTAISPLLHSNGCGPGYLTTSIAGSYIGTPNTNYYLMLSINTDANGHLVQWNNSGIALLTW